MASRLHRSLIRQLATNAATLLVVALLIVVMLPNTSVATAHVNVARPAQEVWAVLDNPGNTPAWLSDVRAYQAQGQRHDATGPFTLRMQDGRSYVVERTALKTAGELLLDATRADGRQSVVVSLLLTSAPSGTEIDAVVRVHSLSVLEQIRALFSPDSDAKLAEVLKKLAAEVESLSPPPTPAR